MVENPSGVRSLADLIAFNDNNKELEEPEGYEDQGRFVCSFYFARVITIFVLHRLIESQATNGRDKAFLEALAYNVEAGAKRGIDAVLKAHNLNALVLPAPGLTTRPAGIYLDLDLHGQKSHTLTAAVAGYPIVTGAYIV